jgi:ParB-like chromosome segregation protein Spo0J
MKDARTCQTLRLVHAKDQDDQAADTVAEEVAAEPVAEDEVQPAPAEPEPKRIKWEDVEPVGNFGEGLEVVYRDPKTLKSHPSNYKIYHEVFYTGRRDNADLLASIKKLGITTPVIITKDGTIVSGDRRVCAAKQLGMTEVPCVVLKTDDPDEILTVLVHSNKHRTKTHIQIGEEVRVLFQVEQRLAAKRKQETQFKKGEKRNKSRDSTVPARAPGPQGDARDVVATALGIGARTVDKHNKINDAIDRFKCDRRKVNKVGSVVAALGKSPEAAIQRIKEIDGEVVPATKVEQMGRALVSLARRVARTAAELMAKPREGRKGGKPKPGDSDAATLRKAVAEALALLREAAKELAPAT